MNCNTWIEVGNVIERCSDKPGCQRFVTTNAQFTNRWIAEELKLLHRLPQFVEYSHATLQQGAPVDGGLDTTLDVGTVQGCIPVAIARAHPHLRGRGFDLPILEAAFTNYIISQGLRDRL